jgi:MFS family permease
VLGCGLCCVCVCSLVLAHAQHHPCCTCLASLSCTAAAAASAGLHGWQWLFLLEGIPPALLGLVVLAMVPDRPAEARWLSDNEKQLLAEDVSRKRGMGVGQLWGAGGQQ